MVDGFGKIVWEDQTNGNAKSKKPRRFVAHRNESIEIGYGKHATTLDVSEFWNRLQGPDYNNKETTSLTKFINRAKGDSNTLDMFFGFQNFLRSKSAKRNC